MSNKKRIAFFGIKYYPSQGGSSRIAESIARELRHKYEITIYCYRHPQATTFMEGVKVVKVPSFPFGVFGVFLYYLVCCVHLLCSKRYHLIHVHKTDSAIFIPLLGFKGKVIATSQEAPYVRDKWKFFGKAYFRLMEWFFVRSRALLTSVSKPLADYYYDKYDRKVHYVPNGVGISTERNFEAADDILRDADTRENEFVFFAARRIMSTKGVHTFLEALRKIKYKYTIVIAGQESHAVSYMDQIKDLADDLEVKFVGYVGDRATLMALIEKARFFVFPSETEGLSLMLLEVGSTGKTPLICSNIPENTQVFSQDDVLYFQNKDAADLADKFLWAEANMNEMLAKASKARNKVINEYSSQVIAGKYEALYQGLLLNNFENIN